MLSTALICLALKSNHGHQQKQSRGQSGSVSAMVSDSTATLCPKHLNLNLPAAARLQTKLPQNSEKRLALYDARRANLCRHLSSMEQEHNNT
jgi:hypothetical protein